MIDLHTHLLPGVDDGSPSITVSVRVLERFAADGVEVLVCTPHLSASRVAHAPHERHAQILDELRAAAPATPRLLLGWEIMLDVPGADFRDRRLCLGGSPAALVEFPRAGVPPQAGRELYRIRASGTVPVVAHPERYYGATPSVIDEWRRSGAVIQVDAAALAVAGRMGDLARLLLEQGLVDVIASDTHGDRRSLAAARQWLVEMGAAEQATLLTRTNPARVLAGEPPLAVPPVTVERGWMQRLRDSLLGRA